jgi:cyclic beta-1,2-glucan synthetase
MTATTLTPPPAAPISSVLGTEPIRRELFGLERLEAHARQLAQAAPVEVVAGFPLLRSFHQNSKALVRAHREISRAYRNQESFGADAEWLLDNFHIIEDTLREVWLDLPQGFYNLLPKLSQGPLAGYPRIYALAVDLIAHCDSSLDESNLTRFIQAYQSIAPLTIGELWAVPIMLRVGLIDNLRRLAEQIVAARRDRQQADAWATDNLLSGDGSASIKVPASVCPPRNLSDPFVVQIVHLLRERGSDPSVGHDWLDSCLADKGVTVHDVVRRAQQYQAANQVSIGNCVTSLRLLSALDWTAFFEKASFVDALLNKDPAGVYAKQDFATRDRYRQQVEKLARGSETDETRVAQLAVDLANQSDGFLPPAKRNGTPARVRDAKTAPTNHVGYYLLDLGREELERRIHYRPTFRDRAQRVIQGWARSIYFGSLALTLTLIVAAIVLVAQRALADAGSGWILALAALVALLPASELALGLVHFLIVRFVPPRVLPKLDIKDGVPAECPTFVVMPSMLVRPESARVLLERLEIHYLSNTDPQLYFALLTDFADAPTEQRPEDAIYVESALEGIRALNGRYCSEGPDRFFLCHRRRLWNQSQGCWMGWERKRGKLAEFNRLLRGARDTSFAVVSGDLSQLPHMRFVITLDADTRLPHEAASRLIGTLAHPLNQPRFDEHEQRVVAGYGLLQPRVSLTLSGAGKTRFTRIWSGSAGIDPYTTAVSDVYQDLFGLGSFTGKGIYDVDAFEAAVGAAFPENQILSHDLIEGNYARCGLVTDIELLDEFPTAYHAYARREHRWVRGDWQIYPWLLPRAPAANQSRRPNALPLVERWKIFDNLRRSLVPPSLLVLLLLGWTVFPGSAGWWSALALAVLGLPLLLQIADYPLHSLRRLLRGKSLPPLPANLSLTLFQGLLSAVFLAEQARLMVDAIVRTLVRLKVTRRNLLEWETAASAERRMRTRLLDSLRNMWFGPLLALIGGLGLAWRYPESLLAAAPFLAAWLVSPWIANWISKAPAPRLPILSGRDRTELRRIARKTWSFFETFVGEQDHWLPPDNYQEDPKDEIAHRTSPTNIGLYLLSCLTAHDFGYEVLEGLVGRLEKTFATLDKVERYRGHLYNWYDTSTLQGLYPVYISTVDSGNFLACLLALDQGLQEAMDEVFPSPTVMEGLTDVVALVQEGVFALKGSPMNAPAGVDVSLERHVHTLTTLLQEKPRDWLDWDRVFERLSQAGTTLLDQLGLLNAELDPESDLRHWCRLLISQVAGHRSQLTSWAPWLPLWRDDAAPAQATDPLASEESARRLQALRDFCLIPRSLRSLHEQTDELLAELEIAEFPPSVTRAWRDRLLRAVAAGGARSLVERCQRLGQRAHEMARVMDFEFLYNHQRHLFAVGYNLSQGRLDNAHYDLLASEACLTSFLTVARGNVPRRHWFQLGRPLTRTAGEVGLVSWGGTMFEYLMPRLLLRPLPGTLLHESQRAAVARQIDYGRQCGVPWGISESAFAAVDVALNYQYQAFGVPGLGLKRGLGNDLVVAPYASVLAVMVAPHEALRNFQRLRSIGGEGTHGFYEAIDFTSERRERPYVPRVVKCVMAHHQAMSFIALANSLFQDRMARRFHAEPIVRATELLLQERMPTDVPLIQPHGDEARVPLIASEAGHHMSRRLSTPHTAHPRTHLLSNGQYTVMVTNAGSGWSTCNGLDVTRWREDATCDSWGQFCYIRDLRTGQIWSAGHHPLARPADSYEVVFSTDKAELRRLDGGIETRLEITVPPDGPVEIRRLTFTNHNSRAHELEVTSYAEVALSSHANDLAHPAFGKLFLETEYFAGEEALLCRRRPRSAEQKPVWGVHVIAVDGAGPGEVQYETDRARFLGRGRTPTHPAALDAGSYGSRSLSGTTGAVLDPIFSLRRRIHVAPDTSVCVAFTTAVAQTRQEALALADQYHDFHGVTRAFELAWAHSQVELRHLHLSAEEAHLFQRLAANVIYASSALRSLAAVAANQLGQSALWRHGISGDKPIVLVRLSEPEELGLVRQMLSAHTYWRLKGLEVDLVILNEHQSGYYEDVQQQVLGLVRSSDDRTLLDKPGGVFIRKGDHLPPDDLGLLKAAARCILIGSRGSLATQVDKAALRKLPPDLEPFHRVRDASGRRGDEDRLPFPSDLLFFNGLGGFTRDGREYVIRVSEHEENRRNRAWYGRPSQDQASAELPPAPWINVVANRLVGFLASESGAGYTWAGNSQMHRLTPWSNDPVSDPPAEVLYLRDEETGAFWSATPLPLGMPATFVVRHGQGYTLYEHAGHGIRHEWLLFMPRDEPLKIMRLRVRNLGRRPRRLSATFFAPWVLGAVREQTAPHVVTSLDEKTGALLARNAFNPFAGFQVAFADVNLRPRTVTSDRTEFLGRNGALDNPAALGRAALSGAVGPALDPCAALQTSFELAPGEEREAIFYLGAAASVDDARALLDYFRLPARVEAAFQKTKQHWDQVLGAVQVQTPNPALDLLLNRWLLYQVLSCRVWGRSAFYQSGGAYGFRDQLQDVLALVHAAPQETREHLLRAAARQFPEGDVQHWWHPPAGGGVRTHCSDDYLWLPFAVYHYVKTTGDATVLDERVSFLQAPLLKQGQEDDYRVPEVSEESAPLFEHCVRAIEHSFPMGPHGLPRIGTGDWNDGMNRVGPEALGESVWNGWFLLTILRDFAELAESRGEQALVQAYRARMELLREALEEHAWDGAWYRRAYFDDGTPLGSAKNDECQIDSIPQSWAVIARAADPDRCRTALAKVEERLVRASDRLILLFTPPFDQGTLEPGYIKGYVPGIRENGGQYTHAALWLVQATALLGKGTRAMELLDLLNPIRHAATPQDVEQYKVEPYVVAADVYGKSPHTGRGGWTWYTGSASWFYRVALETMLGLQRRGNQVVLHPCVPKSWPRFTVTCRIQSSTYAIQVENPNHVERGVPRIEVDGIPQEGDAITLTDDGRTHQVRVVLE